MMAAIVLILLGSGIYLWADGHPMIAASLFITVLLYAVIQWINGMRE